MSSHVVPQNDTAGDDDGWDVDLSHYHANHPSANRFSVFNSSRFSIANANTSANITANQNPTLAQQHIKSLLEDTCHFDDDEAFFQSLPASLQPSSAVPESSPTETAASNLSPPVQLPTAGPSGSNAYVTARLTLHRPVSTTANNSSVPPSSASSSLLTPTPFNLSDSELSLTQPSFPLPQQPLPQHPIVQIVASDPSSIDEDGSTTHLTQNNSVSPQPSSSPWIELVSVGDDGYRLFYNRVTKETSHLRPDNLPHSLSFQTSSSPGQYITAGVASLEQSASSTTTTTTTTTPLLSSPTLSAPPKPPHLEHAATSAAPAGEGATGAKVSTSLYYPNQLWSNHEKIQFQMNSIAKKLDACIQLASDPEIDPLTKSSLATVKVGIRQVMNTLKTSPADQNPEIDVISSLIGTTSFSWDFSLNQHAINYYRASAVKHTAYKSIMFTNWHLPQFFSTQPFLPQANKVRLHISLPQRVIDQYYHSNAPKAPTVPEPTATTPNLATYAPQKMFLSRRTLMEVGLDEPIFNIIYRAYMKLFKVHHNPGMRTLDAAMSNKSTSTTGAQDLDSPDASSTVLTACDSESKPSFIDTVAQNWLLKVNGQHAYLQPPYTLGDYAYIRQSVRELRDPQLFLISKESIAGDMLTPKQIQDSASLAEAYQTKALQPAVTVLEPTAHNSLPTPVSLDHRDLAALTAIPSSALPMPLQIELIGVENINTDNLPRLAHPLCELNGFYIKAVLFYGNQEFPWCYDSDTTSTATTDHINPYRRHFGHDSLCSIDQLPRETRIGYILYGKPAKHPNPSQPTHDPTHLASSRHSQRSAAATVAAVHLTNASSVPLSAPVPPVLGSSPTFSSPSPPTTGGAVVGSPSRPGTSGPSPSGGDSNSSAQASVASSSRLFGRSPPPVVGSSVPVPSGMASSAATTTPSSPIVVVPGLHKSLVSSSPNPQQCGTISNFLPTPTQPSMTSNGASTASTVSRNDIPLAWVTMNLFNERGTMLSGLQQHNMWPLSRDLGPHSKPSKNMLQRKRDLDPHWLFRTSPISNNTTDGDWPVQLRVRYPSFPRPVVCPQIPKQTSQSQPIGAPVSSSSPPAQIPGPPPRLNGQPISSPQGFGTQGRKAAGGGAGAFATGNMSNIPPHAPLNVSISRDQSSELLRLIQTDPLFTFNAADRQIIWYYRYHLVDIPSALTKVVRSLDWLNIAQRHEMYRLLSSWKKNCFLQPIDVIELLDFKFPDYQLRLFAVKYIQQLNDYELSLILLQLIQSVKYESYYDNPLTRLLIQRAIACPYLIGHPLYWHLKAEIHDPQYTERFTLMLEELLSHIGFYTIDLTKQIAVMDKLQQVADYVIRLKRKYDFNDEETTVKYHAMLNELNTNFFSKLGPFHVPLNPKWQVTTLLVDKCRFMSSKMVPLWLVFRNADPDGPPIYFIFKSGDDLRQDMLTLQILRIMDQLWLQHGLDLRLTAYDVMATGVNTRGEGVGMIEVVLNSDTTSSIQVKYGGGAHGALKSQPIDTYLQAHNPTKELSLTGVTSSNLVEHIHYTDADINTIDISMPTASIGQVLSQDVSATLVGGPNQRIGSSSTSSLFNTAPPTLGKNRLLIGQQENAFPLRPKPPSQNLDSSTSNLAVISSNTRQNITSKINSQDQQQSKAVSKYAAAVDNFVRSCAGYCVATFVLGIGDRHNSNIMVTQTGHLFHIDFGHFLGNFKKKFGVNRERAAFVFTPEMAYVMGGKDFKNSPIFKQFRILCARSFHILRQYGYLLEVMFILTVAAGMPELLRGDDILYLRDKLYLGSDSKQAQNHFMDELKRSLDSRYRRVDNYLHNLKHG